MPEAKIGVIGGSGLYEIEGFTDIEEVVSSTPEKFKLHPIFPNPFNPSATINYSLPRSGNMLVEVFNLAGQKTAVLFDGYQSAGEHTIHWEASGLSSGIYFVRLSCGESSTTARATLLK